MISRLLLRTGQELPQLPILDPSFRIISPNQRRRQQNQRTVLLAVQFELLRHLDQ
jgi:hypothetical protein